MHTLSDVLTEGTKFGRVCPMPDHWNKLWNLLPDKRRQGAGWNPPVPLILGAWNHTSNFEKRERFHDHIRWADGHGCLEVVAQFIQKLNQDDWHIEE